MRAAPTMTPIACEMLRPRARSEEARVQEVAFTPVMIQYAAYSRQVQVRRGGGMGMRSRLHQRVFL